MVKQLLVATFVSCAASSPAPAVPLHANCGATITGSFADSCRDFTAHSSKDISYVELHYADGRVVRHRSIHSHHYAIDGGPGGEIDSARVKSGTTLQEFDCEPGNAAPTALLEMETPPIDQTLETCYDFFAGGLACEQSSPRTAWTNDTQVLAVGGDDSGHLLWGCGGLTPPSLCPFTIKFRGTGSTDPDGDIASWSLDFGDGTSASGAWSSAPTAVTHLYALEPVTGTYCRGIPGFPFVCEITLTVTDSAGQSGTDRMLMVFLDQSPD